MVKIRRTEVSESCSKLRVRRIDLFLCVFFRLDFRSECCRKGWERLPLWNVIPLIVFLLKFIPNALQKILFGKTFMGAIKGGSIKEGSNSFQNLRDSRS